MVRAWIAVVALAGCGGGDPPQADAVCREGVVYLSRGGGMYEGGPVDDPASNRSVLLDAPQLLGAWPNGDFAEVAACIRAGLAPFALEVTEVDPGPQRPHVEIVFTDRYWAGPVGTTHVVPDGCLPHRVEFVFGDALPTSARACHIAMLGFAQLTANLSVAEDCNDFANLAMDCSPSRAFVDGEAHCVDALNQPAACRCGGETQNSFRAISQAFPPCV
jgi:hypothetical protein